MDGDKKIEKYFYSKTTRQASFLGGQTKFLKTTWCDVISKWHTGYLWAQLESHINTYSNRGHDVDSDRTHS